MFAGLTFETTGDTVTKCNKREGRGKPKCQVTSFTELFDHFLPAFWRKKIKFKDKYMSLINNCIYILIQLYHKGSTWSSFCWGKNQKVTHTSGERGSAPMPPNGTLGRGRSKKVWHIIWMAPSSARTENAETTKIFNVFQGSRWGALCPTDTKSKARKKENKKCFITNSKLHDS